MSHASDFEKCKSFISHNLQPSRSEVPVGAGTGFRPIVTLSRQTGAGALTVAAKLADYLQARNRTPSHPWTVFDKNLVQQVLADHHLPQRLAEYIQEHKISEFDDAVGELLGLHPSQWTLVQHATDTILKLARMGHVILVGRGATIITGKFKNAVHVRLVGSLEQRAQHAQEYFHLDTWQALKYVREEDHRRERYVRKYFEKRIDDPLLYHLVINTDLVSLDEAAQIIGEAVLRRTPPA